MRDATYQSLLKRARATLHEQFVDWAERVNAERGRGAEFEEILGYHLEQAVRYRGELGPLDEHGRELGQRAATKLSSAGMRALDRSDMPAAASLLGRSVELLEPRDPIRLELVAGARRGADGALALRGRRRPCSRRRSRPPAPSATGGSRA